MFCGINLTLPLLFIKFYEKIIHLRYVCQYVQESSLVLFF
uniref:Uncharacterized protein n=1 Tax=Arundo donax TaxID=35708 RepID=A0A0A9CI20_ARUDO